MPTTAEWLQKLYIFICILLRSLFPFLLPFPAHNYIATKLLFGGTNELPKLHSFPRQLAHPITNSPSKFCATLLFICTNKQVCHRRVCHLSLYFSQQASVPLSNLQKLFFLFSNPTNKCATEGCATSLSIFPNKQYATVELANSLFIA